MSFQALCSIILASLLASNVSSQVIDCGSGSTVFKIQSQGFEPTPPLPGKDATLWIDFTVPQGTTVTGGTSKYSITFNGIPFSPTIQDLCTQVTCPIQSQNLTSTSQWPMGLSGKVISKIQWYDENQTYLLCSQLTVKS